ncbi:MAG: nitroreductase family protein [Desulfobacterales bacterium]|jgi:nitroreductase
MDDLLKLMKTRRSIRRYQDKDVPDELLEKIMEAGRWAPSGDNGQPWRFIVVRDMETKMALSRIATEGSGRRFTAEYFTGRLDERFEGLKDEEKKARVYQKLRSGAVSSFLVDAPVIIVVCACLDVWDVSYDVALATQNMQLMAHALGLGTCVVVAPVCDMIDEVEAAKLLKIPHGYKVALPLAVGYPAENPRPRPRWALEDIVYYEEFGKRRGQ